jgi:hypothetical protein
MSPEREREVVKALTDPALGWLRDARGAALAAIARICRCTAGEAEIILRDLVDRDAIELVSESGGTPAAERTMDSYGWKWVVTPKARQTSR